MTNTVVLPKRKRRPVDKTLPVIMTLLLMMGLVTLFSATYYNAQDSGDALSEVKKQLFGMAVGFAAMLFTSRIPYWFWGRHRVALAGLGLSAVLLVLVIIPGVGVYINGSRRWLRLGPLSFQPSELAKYAVVLFVALALAARGKARAALLYGHPSGADCAGCDVPADIGAAQPVHGGHDYHRQRYSGHAGRGALAAHAGAGRGGLGAGRVLCLERALSP